MKETNILIELLSALKVKYTQNTALKVYREHPHRYDLYGISSMLTLYGIENKGIKLDDKEQIREIEEPFIAHAHNDFVLVKKIHDNIIKYLWNDKWITAPLGEFMEIWSGILLIAEADEKSIEPNYRMNRRTELIDGFLLNFFVCIVFVCLLFFSVNSGLWKSFSYLVLILLQLIGLSICFLLLQKQMKLKSDYADKLCSLFNKNDCNNVLESDAALFLGVFSWSEIGLGYFISTLFICMIFPQWIHYCAWISILTLPYVFWSIWYQRSKVKQWCPLCLIIMNVFGALFITYLLSGYLNVFAFKWTEVLWVGLLYIIPFMIILKLVPLITEALSKRQLVYEMNNIKFNEDVFSLLLRKNLHYDVSLSTSHIVFGNPHAKTLISVLTNPHCEPCAVMHKRLIKLLLKTENRYCIQYIFSSFDETLGISSKMLISAYFSNKVEETTELYDYWFNKGKYHKEIFFEQNNLLIDNFVNDEFIRHETWKKQSKLYATPTILINGYELPKQYKIEDIEFLDV